MKPEDQIKALAEVDGWIKVWPDNRTGQKPFHSLPALLPDWLTSYDAIIPLMQKQDVMVNIEDEIEKLNKSCFWYDATPSQLCEALLRATGKWTE